jgi:hypothetical protein
MMKARTRIWVRHVAYMGENRNVYRILVGKPKGRTPLERPRRRCEGNIEMDLTRIGGMYQIRVAQDSDHLWALVNMNLRVLETAQKFLVCERFLASQEGLGSMELDI